MSRVFVHGIGAVSPAGWGVPALRAALETGAALPTRPLARPGWEKPLQVLAVPPPAQKLEFLAHARLRRASPMTHYTVGAALEALGSDVPAIKSGAIRLGIIECTMTGGISYSRRFYEEVLANPATASPLVFPETVFNAPASHLAAYLGATVVNYSNVGDPGTFLQSLALAAQWLEDGVADACAVIGAEEIDWTAADALRLFDKKATLSAGAGVLYLKLQPASIELTAVTDSFQPSNARLRPAHLQTVKSQLPPGTAVELLCATPEADAACIDWPGQRVVPRRIFGEGFAADSAWQCVAACDAVQRCQCPAVNVMVSGTGCQTIGGRFVNTNFKQ